MELVEPIEEINRRLEDIFGQYLDGQPNWRVVWSEDQFEKRKTNYTSEGFPLLHTEVRQLPKYRHYIKEKYILERLVEISEHTETDLVTNLSYEPMWTFEDRRSNPLPPRFEVCQFIIETVYINQGKITKYSHANDDPDNPENREKRLNKLHEELFGDESPTGTSMSHGEAIVVPPNFERSK